MPVKSKQKTPEQIARTLRDHFEKCLPIDQYMNCALGFPMFTAYEWICLVQEQCHCENWEQAEKLALRIVPEFTAEYWENRVSSVLVGTDSQEAQNGANFGAIGEGVGK